MLNILNVEKFSRSKIRLTAGAVWANRIGRSEVLRSRYMRTTSLTNIDLNLDCYLADRTVTCVRYFMNSLVRQAVVFSFYLFPRKQKELLLCGG